MHIALTISVQDRLVELVDNIGSYLDFQELDQAMQMLNHPGETLTFEADFLYMVERVDICIDFLKVHVRLFNLCHSLWYSFS